MIAPLKKYTSYILIFISLLLASSGSAQSPAITPDIDIDQDRLMNGEYTLRKVVESGRHLFAVPFTKEEGFGEGPTGPRRSYQTLFDAPGFEFIRLNGLDAQSCFECHNSIGTDNLKDTQSLALDQKPGATAGAAPFASNAFINPDFPTSTTKFIRNPPHVFGTGYAQRLASEMTEDLLTIRDAVHAAAMSNPDVEQSMLLTAKGTDYGTYKATFESGMGQIVPDFSEVEGVSEDFVVRPFQWKGIASTERNFVRDALNFHFSIQPVELFFEDDASTGGRGVIIAETDEDADGFENEMSVGNVTALTVFSVLVRPPTQIIPDDQATTVARGREIFEGTAGDIDFMGTDSCVTCHTPSLRIDNPLLTIIDPRDEFTRSRLAPDWVPTLGTPVASSRELPAHKKHTREMELIALDDLMAESATPREFAEAIQQRRAEARLARVDANPLAPGYQIHLTRPSSGISAMFPRLPDNSDGSIDVPLYSDLKRHDMGEGLADVEPQGTDAAGVMVPAREFLTRPLWGVGDTGPWLHDGRATTLQEAILLHKSTGSEANPVIDVFESLSEADKEAVEQFLLTLRLPLDQQFRLPSLMIVE